MRKMCVTYRLTAIALAWLLSTAPATAGGQIVFSLSDTHGKVHTLAEYAGKWVIVNYWATSCAACLKEIPQLETFHEQHKDRDAVVLGVDFEEIPASWLRDFMDSVSMSYPVLRSDPSPATPFGMVIALPTTFVISPAGELLARQIGPVTAADLDAYIKRTTRIGQTKVPATKPSSKIR